MPVNAIAWRAALDIASLVPLADVDTFGGTIVTEWYSLADRPDERIKLTIFVVGRELRSDSISVRVHVQQRMADGWGEAVRDEALARQIEELILARARAPCRIACRSCRLTFSFFIPGQIDGAV